MQLQPQTPPIRGRREKREGERTDPTPEAAEQSLEKVVADMRQRGEVEVADAKALIAQAHAAAERTRAETAKKTLVELEADVDAAWEELSTNADAMVAQATKEIEHLTEDQIMEQVNETIKQALTGNREMVITLERFLEHPMSRDIAERFLQEELGVEVQKLLKRPTFDPTSWQETLKIGTLKPVFWDALRSSLGEKIGANAAEKFLNDSTYRERISLLEKNLAQTLSSGGPRLMEERSLQNLIAVFETVGEHAISFIEAIDLKTIATQLEHYQSTSVIEIDRAEAHAETGELLTKVSFNLVYRDPAQPPNKENKYDTAIINRNFFRYIRKGDNLDTRASRYVEHTSFQLPDSIKDADTASRITRRSLELYKEEAMDLEEIKLHANIDVGGYAWASYGYGWDYEKMGLNRLSKLKERGEEAPREAELTEMERVELGMQEVSEIIQDIQTIFESIRGGMAQRGSEYPTAAADLILKEIDAARNNPNVTPQHLVLIGASAPRLFKGSDGEYYLENEWEKAQAKGITAVSGFEKKAAHIGKLGLLSSKWFGKIELKQNGNQKGRNLELLQKTLERRAASI